MTEATLRLGSLHTAPWMILYLDELATDCAADGRWKFLFVAPPLPVVRAIGAPINPYALR
jgi:hypothetical protein